MNTITWERAYRGKWMHVRGQILSLISGIVAALALMSGASEAKQLTAGSCADNISEFQTAREAGVFGEPWNGDRLLGLRRQQCSASGWLLGLRDFCSQRGQLSAGAVGSNGLELCLYRQSWTAMDSNAGQMAAFAEMIRGVDTQTPMTQASATAKYTRLVEQFEPSAGACTSSLEVSLEEAVQSGGSQLSCHKYVLANAAKEMAESDEYGILYARHEVGANLYIAQRTLAIEEDNLASIVNLLAEKRAKLRHIIRLRNNTSNPQQVAEYNREINEIEREESRLEEARQNAAQVVATRRVEMVNAESAFRQAQREVN